jgi:hypothetical protein
LVNSIPLIDADDKQTDASYTSRHLSHYVTAFCMAINRQFVQEYFWNRAATPRYAVNAALFPASSAAASVASAFEAISEVVF